ncbi:MAG: hypothetical protein V3V08_08365 [Nannocystaceae bacterium]
MRALCCLFLLLVSAACKSGTPGGSASGNACDSEALRKLSAELSAMQPGDAMRAVWEPVKAACGDALPADYELQYGKGGAASSSTARTHGADKRSDELNQLSCPAGVDKLGESLANAPVKERDLAAFQACDYARYGVVTEAEVIEAGFPSWATWGIHALMLKDGLSADEARGISQALYARERHLQATILFGDLQRFPVAEGLVLADGLTFSLTSSELIFGNIKVVQLNDGVLDSSAVNKHLIASLYDELLPEVAKMKATAGTSESAWEGRAVLAMDATIPFGTLVDLLYTAGRAEFQHYSIVVATNNGIDVRQIPVEPPRFSGFYARRDSMTLSNTLPNYRLPAQPRNDGKLDEGLDESS